MSEYNAPWTKFYKGTPTHIDYPKISMCEAVFRAANAHPENVAYEFEGKKTKYKDFSQKICKVAKAFSAFGIQKNDMVTICMPNTPQAVDSFYALNRIGAISVMIHPLSAPGEIAFFLEHTNSKTILVLDLFLGKVREALKSVPYPVRIIVAHIEDELPFPQNILYPLTLKKKPEKFVENKSIINWKSLLSLGNKIQSLPDDFPQPDDVASILFSGGTTGRSKGICLSNLNINSASIQTSAVAGFPMEGMRMLSVMPMFHGFGLGVGIHTPLIFGATCILVPRFSVKTYAKLIIKRKPNVLPGVPTLFEALLRTKGLEKHDMSNIRGVFSGGDSLSIELKKKVDTFLKEHNAKVQIREGYGTTECVTACCLTPHDFFREGSIGIPHPDTYFKIVDPHTNETIPYGEIGEICISGPSVMLGYLNNPEETENTLKTHSDGHVWLHTGDLGMMDEDGFVYFKQRMKRLIVVSGYNVYPSQIENTIDAHPSVLYSCAIGVPDPYKMHKVKAFVVLKPGVEPSDDIKAEILTHCRKNIAKFAMPYAIEFREELPKTLVGKIAYRELEEEENAKLSKQSE